MRRDCVPKACCVTGFRVAGGNANAYSAWLAMGSPQSPTLDQVAALHTASQLAPAKDIASTASVSDGTASVSLLLPRQGVVLLIVE